MAKVQLHDVRKSYGGTEVIHGVSIDAADGGWVTAAVFYVKDKLYMLQATAAGPDPAARSSRRYRLSPVTPATPIASAARPRPRRRS